MLYPLQELSVQSRVWVYTADRFITVSEEAKLEEIVSSFVENWTAHNEALKASFVILHGTVLLIAVDESAANASGCSQDKLSQCIKKTEKELGLTLLDRFRVVAKNGDEWLNLHANEFVEKVKSGQLSRDTTVVNTLITELGDLRVQFELPASSTWLNRYFN